MKMKFVEVQGKFSGDGKFTEAVYVPQIVDELMQEAYDTIGSSKGLNRLRITVEVEDLGDVVRFGGNAMDAQAKDATPSCITAGKLVQPAVIPVPEVV